MVVSHDLCGVLVDLGVPHQVHVHTSQVEAKF
jgi:hypothetical protein